MTILVNDRARGMRCRCWLHRSAAESAGRGCVKKLQGADPAVTCSRSRSRRYRGKVVARERFRRLRKDVDRKNAMAATHAGKRKLLTSKAARSACGQSAEVDIPAGKAL